MANCQNFGYLQPIQATGIGKLIVASFFTSCCRAYILGSYRNEQNTPSMTRYRLCLWLLGCKMLQARPGDDLFDEDSCCPSALEFTSSAQSSKSFSTSCFHGTAGCSGLHSNHERQECCRVHRAGGIIEAATSLHYSTASIPRQGSKSNTETECLGGSRER